MLIISQNAVIIIHCWFFWKILCFHHLFWRGVIYEYMQFFFSFDFRGHQFYCLWFLMEFISLRKVKWPVKNNNSHPKVVLEHHFLSKESAMVAALYCGWSQVSWRGWGCSYRYMCQKSLNPFMRMLIWFGEGKQHAVNGSICVAGLGIPRGRSASETGTFTLGGELAKVWAGVLGCWRWNFPFPSSSSSASLLSSAACLLAVMPVCLLTRGAWNVYTFCFVLTKLQPLVPVRLNVSLF